MAEIPSLHIDDDWKKQAQEEKRRLAEEEAKKKAAPAEPTSTAGSAAGAGRSPAGRRRPGETPEASMATLVQSMMTQALYYLGELGGRSGQSSVDLDMAKLQIDLLSLVEEKTKGNLSADEQQMLDTALYETRMRFVAVARDYVTQQ